MQIKLHKQISLVLFLIFVSTTNAGTIVPMKALCFAHKNECIQMRKRLDSRDQAPVYSYTHPCSREEVQLNERTRVNCRQGEWKLLMQLRSNYTEFQLNNYFTKVGHAPLRSSCVNFSEEASEIISDIQKSANCTEWRSVKDNYKIETSYRELSKSEMDKLKNKECENKRILVEYKIKKTL